MAQFAIFVRMTVYEAPPDNRIFYKLGIVLGQCHSDIRWICFTCNVVITLYACIRETAPPS